MKTVPEALAALGELYAVRNAVYGDDYLRHGEIMRQLFPNGITLKTIDDFNRYALLKDIVTKLSRYGPNFADGGHEDSLADLSVYAAMLNYVDQKVKEKKDVGEK